MVAISWMALLVMVAALVAGAYVLAAAFGSSQSRRKSRKAGRKCASCGHVAGAAGKYCGKCGKKLD